MYFEDLVGILSRSADQNESGKRLESKKIGVKVDSDFHSGLQTLIRCPLDPQNTPVCTENDGEQNRQLRKNLLLKMNYSQEITLTPTATPKLTPCRALILYIE